MNKVRRTTVITAGMVAVLGGLGFARVMRPSLVVVAILCLLSLVAAWRRRKLSLLIVLVFWGFALGWWRGGQYLRRIEPYQQLARQPVVLEVVAESDAVYGLHSQLSFDGQHVRILRPQAMALPGRLKVEGFGERAVYRGDVVRVEGTLVTRRGSRIAGVSYANLHLVSHNTSVFEHLRLRFVAGMMSALPEPQASFALGLLIGQRTTLPDEVTASLAAVGLTHIVAVSGYNLTIIIRGVQRFRRRLSKYQIAMLSLFLMGSFVLVTGFSASIVRAALVSILSVGAWYYGRTFRPVLLLVLVAAVTALYNPLYVWSDIGWYLSFLAFFGVLILAPLCVRRVYGSKEPGAVVAVLAETAAAQIMTAPLILYIFGQISVIGLVGNMLVVPLVPAAMLLSLVAGLAGMVMPVLAGWLAVPARVLLSYMLEMARVLAAVPHALAHGHLAWPWMLGLYGGLIILCLALWRQTGVKHAILQPEEIDTGEETRVRT